MLLRTTLVIFLVALSSQALPAKRTPKPKQNFEEALRQARNPLVLSDGKLLGTGAILLNAAVQQSRFVMLGEDHMTREIPQFAAALCDIMHPDAYAVKAGPSAARFVNGLRKSPIA